MPEKLDNTSGPKESQPSLPLVSPLETLIGAANDLAQGKLGSRTGLSDREDKIGDLATAFDAMAEEIEYREKELHRIQRAFSALTAGNRALLRAEDEPSLLAKFCRVIVEVGGYPMAWVGYADHDSLHRIRVMTSAGDDSTYLNDLKLSWSKAERNRGPAARALLTGRPAVVHDVRHDPTFARWREVALKRGYSSILSLPLKERSGDVLGVLSIHAPETNAFSPKELDVLAQLAEDLAFGISAQRLRLAHENAEATIHRLAFYDPLTKLANFTRLIERLEDIIAGDQRSRARLILLSLDVDRFSEINHALGYANGNRMLQELGRRLQQTEPRPDVVARSGEDEFALVFTEIDADRAEWVAQKIHALLEAPINLDEIDVQAHASIGIAHYLDDDEDAESFLRRAVIARDHAKRQKTETAIYQVDADTTDRERIVLIGDLHQAIANNEFSLVYQPKETMAGGMLCGAEALLRWRHPIRGMVPPSEFIALAEHTGYIRKLTDWIVESVISQQSLWSGGAAATPLAVNLSAKNLHDPRMLTRILDLLDCWNVSPNFLQIEITESTLMVDPIGARDILGRLRNRGIRIYVDDFGTGYSSLSYLATLPVHGIKIDRSFVGGLVHKGEQRAIVEAIISLAHALDLEVVAEGVETPAQDEMLRRMDCDVAQGYLITPPLPPDEFEQWCIARTRRAGSVFAGIPRQEIAPRENDLKRELNVVNQRRSR